MNPLNIGTYAYQRQGAEYGRGNPETDLSTKRFKQASAFSAQQSPLTFVQTPIFTPYVPGTKIAADGAEAANPQISYQLKIKGPRPLKRELDFVADLFPGLVLFARVGSFLTDDQLQKRKREVSYNTSYDILAWHQLNLVLMRRALGDEQFREFEITPEKAFKAYHFIGIMKRERSDFISRSEINPIVTQLMGLGVMQNVLTTQADGENRVFGVFRYTANKTDVSVVPFSGIRSAAMRVGHFNRVTNERVRYFTQVVPILSERRRLPPSTLVSYIDDGSNVQLAVPSFAVQIGRIWHNPTPHPDFSHASRVDQSVYQDYTALELGRGTRTAEGLRGYPQLRVHVANNLIEGI